MAVVIVYVCVTSVIHENVLNVKLYFSDLTGTVFASIHVGEKRGIRSKKKGAGRREQGPGSRGQGPGSRV